MSVYTDKVRPPPPPPPHTLSEVIYQPLEVVVRALKKAHICALCT